MGAFSGVSVDSARSEFLALDALNADKLVVCAALDAIGVLSAIVGMVLCCDLDGPKTPIVLGVLGVVEF